MRRLVAFLSVASVALLAACGSTAANATSYPSKPVVLVVEHGAGGSIDTGARLLQPYLQKYLGQSVTVENKVGAGGNIGRKYVYDAKPDGYTLLMTYQPSMSLGQILNHGKFNALKFSPVFNIYGGSDNVVASPPNSPFKSFADLKKSKRPITVAVAGIANDSWLASIYLERLAGLPLQIVPFNSGSQAVDAALGGHVELSATTSTTILQTHRAGHPLTALVQFGSKPVKALASVPTIGSLGYPSAAYDVFLGIYGPPGLPANVVAKLDAALKKATADPAFVKKATKAGYGVVPMGPKAFEKAVVTDYNNVKKQSAVLRQALKTSVKPPAKKKHG